MLQDLSQLLIDNGLAIREEIKNIKKSCCPSSKEVLDYDAIKDKYCKVQKIAKVPKSCDALLIEASNNRLVFIEMKEFITVFDEINKGNLTFDEARDRIDYAFKVEFAADKKILDSLMLLLDIAIQYGINDSFFPYFLSNHCKKSFYFVLGCSPRDFVRYHLAILPLKYKYEYFKLGQAEFIPANNFDQVFP